MVNEIDIPTLRKAVNKRLGEFHAAKARHREEKEALTAARQDQGELREALAIAQQVAQAVQEEAHSKIADVVSRSLEAVFDEPYQFKIHFEQRRGKTDAVLVFERDGMEVDPMTAAGGGVVDIASFSLRLSCLMLARPPLRRVLILDEPFRFVSAEYRPRVRQLVESLAQEMDVQFLIVTHSPEFRIGKVIEL